MPFSAFRPALGCASIALCCLLVAPAAAQGKDPSPVAALIREGLARGPYAMQANSNQSRAEMSLQRVQAENGAVLKVRPGYQLGGNFFPYYAYDPIQIERTSAAIEKRAFPDHGPYLALSLESPLTSLQLQVDQPLQSGLDSGANCTVLNLNLNQTLYDGFPGGRQTVVVDQARSVMESQLEQIRQSRKNLAVEIELAWEALQESRRLLEVRKSFLKLYEDEYAVAVNLQKTGMATELDLAQADSSRQMAMLDLGSARLLVANCCRKVSLLTGIAPQAVNGVVADLGAVDRTAPDVDTIKELARRNRPEQRLAELAGRIANLENSLSLSKANPAIKLEGDVAWQIPWNSAVPNFVGCRVALYADFSLLDAGAAQLRAQGSKQAAEAAGLQSRIAAAQSDGDVEAAAAAFADCSQRRRYSQTKVAATKRAWAVILTRVEAGIDNFQSSQSALAQHLTAELDLVRSIGDENRAWIELYRTAGCPGEWSGDLSQNVPGELVAGNGVSP